MKCSPQKVQALVYAPGVPKIQVAAPKSAAGMAGMAGIDA